MSNKETVLENLFQYCSMSSILLLTLVTLNTPGGRTGVSGPQVTDFLSALQGSPGEALNKDELLSGVDAANLMADSYLKSEQGRPTLVASQLTTELTNSARGFLFIAR